MDLDKLLETGDRCIHDEPPACTASCPVHLDVEAFVTETEQGNFKNAYKLMEKRIPFAGVIGMICDHPCEDVCVRQDAGGAIGISELEKAAALYGYSLPKKNIPIPKNKGKVAIAGGGLSGLTAACDLDRKGYRVVIYEKSDRLGGRIWDYEGELLNRERILEQLRIVEENGITVNLNSPVDRKRLEALASEYDAVFIGTGEWEEELDIHPETFQTGCASVFAGGRLAHRSWSVINSVSSGRRAAISIARYLDKVSITASREREGVFRSQLEYREENQVYAERIKKSSAVYTEEEAAREAARCYKCRCNLCIKACVHLQRFKMPPNAYIRQINQNERIIMGTHYANKMINSCTLCGLCKEQCFLDISMKDVIQETRESMTQKGIMPPSAHDFALKDMLFSIGDRFFMVRRQPETLYPRETVAESGSATPKDSAGAAFKDSGRTAYLFYPGCQLSASYPEYIGDIYRYLVEAVGKAEAKVKPEAQEKAGAEMKPEAQEKDGAERKPEAGMKAVGIEGKGEGAKGAEEKVDGGVGLFLGCCGAPADWAGRQDLIREVTGKIRQVWEEYGKPVFILACSSCTAVFGKYLPEIKTVSLWEMFVRYGLPKGKTPAKDGGSPDGKADLAEDGPPDRKANLAESGLSGRKADQAGGSLVLNIHDACATRYSPNIHDSVRTLAESLGYVIKEPAYTREKTKCCGYGGLVYFANPEQADDFIRDRIRECPEDLLVYCAMCRELFAGSGKKTYHILDLILGESLEKAAQRKKPTLSERRANRIRLKQSLLREIWEEEQDLEPMRDADFKLTIPDSVMEVMEKRHILIEDVLRVVDNARKKGECFFNSENSNFLARLRLDNVTYWVRYEEKGHEVLVNSVYSHRMEVVEE